MRTVYRERPDPAEFGAFYAGYVARVPEGDLVSILRTQIAGTTGLLIDLDPDLADHAYAPGKWTVKQVVGHLADSERVFAYRALRLARADATELPGFDENAYVEAAGFQSRSLGELVDELSAVRRATATLFAGLPPDAWPRRGVASGSPVSVRALACIIAGHELHHRAILQERYLAASHR